MFNLIVEMLLVYALDSNLGYLGLNEPLKPLVLETERWKADVYDISNATITWSRVIHQILKIDDFKP